jgi:predicted ATP-dependent serine protease
MNEIWVCSNCFSRGALDLHGRCSSCGSDAVIPESRLPEKGGKKKRKSRTSRKKKEVDELHKMYGAYGLHGND